MAVRHLSFFILALSVILVAADKELQSGKIKAKALGKSGKLFIARRGSDNKFDFTDSFTLEVDYVKQLDADGKEVGKPVNGLANQDFTFSPINNDAKYQNVSAANVNLNAYLDAPKATLKLEIYIFKEAGNLTFGNEQFEVKNGTLKMLITVVNYTFCDGTKNNEQGCKESKPGVNLDVAILIKSKGGKDGKKRDDKDKGKGPIKCVKGKKCGIHVQFDATEVVFTESIIVDGEVKTSPSGYPKIVAKGSDKKQRFIFRTGTFNHTCIFDPTIVVEDDSSDGPGSPTQPSIASSIQISLSMLLAMLIAMFM